MLFLSLFLLKEDIDKLYSNLAKRSSSLEYYTATIGYSNYFMARLEHEYVEKMHQSIPHDWRLGVFAQNVQDMLDSNWLVNLLEGVDKELLGSPLQICEVSTVHRSDQGFSQN